MPQREYCASYERKRAIAVPELKFLSGIGMLPSTRSTSASRMCALCWKVVVCSLASHSSRAPSFRVLKASMPSSSINASASISIRSRVRASVVAQREIGWASLAHRNREVATNSRDALLSADSV